MFTTDERTGLTVVALLTAVCIGLLCNYGMRGQAPLGWSREIVGADP